MEYRKIKKGRIEKPTAVDLGVQYLETNVTDEVAMDVTLFWHWIRGHLQESTFDINAYV